MEKDYKELVIGSVVKKSFLESSNMETLRKITDSHIECEIADEEWLKQEFGITREEYDLDNVEIIYPKNLKDCKPCYDPDFEQGSFVGEGTREILEDDDSRVNAFQFENYIKIYKRTSGPGK